MLYPLRPIIVLLRPTVAIAIYIYKVYTTLMRVTIPFSNDAIFKYDKVITIIGNCRDAWFASQGFPGCIVDGISIVSTDLVLMYIAEFFHNDKLSLDPGPGGYQQTWRRHAGPGHPDS